MARKLEMEVKVGLFVTIGVGLTALAILVLGSTESIFQRKLHFVSHLPTAEGLINGAKVVLGGINVGTVEDISFDGRTHDVLVRYSVKKESSQWVRGDSSMEVATQGMLGDKYVSISPGAADQPEVPDGGEIPFKPSKDLNQFLSKGDQLMMSLNNISVDLDRILRAFDKDNRADVFFQNMAQTSKNLKSMSEKLDSQLTSMKLHSAINNLNQILEKINNGTGTVGALINDPALYDNVKSLVGGANRNRIIRNLVRQTVESGEAKEGKK